MPQAPPFAIVPPIRCCELVDGVRRVFCSELAVVRRPGATYWFDEFFCLEHAAPSDVPIEREPTFRRVHLVCDVYFAGVSVQPAIAQTEAVARLEAAVREFGGLVTVQAARSTIGRGTAPHGVRRGNGAPADSH